MKKILVCLAIFLSCKGFAILPPMAQSIREMKAILDDSRLYDSFGAGEVIRQMIRLKEGYLVITNHYEMVVGVRYQRDQRHIGPTPFKLEFHSPRSLSHETYSRFIQEGMLSNDESLLGG